MATVNEKMTAIADAIRSKTGGTGSLSLDGMAEAITNIEVGEGVELPTLTNEGTGSDLLSGKQLIDSNGEIVTGTIETKSASDLTASGATVTVPAGYYATQATKSVKTAEQKKPGIGISNKGLITSSVSYDSGYVESGIVSAHKQMTTQAAQTITPSTSDKTIASGRYLTGTQTIKGDSNLVADNIKKGVSIFGVTGTHEGGEDLTAVLNRQAEIITQLETALENAASGGSGGGTSLETSQVTVAASAFPVKVCYSPTLGEVVEWSADEPGVEAQIECVKGTIICVHSDRLGVCTFVGCEHISSDTVLVTDPVARIE